SWLHGRLCAAWPRHRVRPVPSSSGHHGSLVGQLRGIEIPCFSSVDATDADAVFGGAVIGEMVMAMHNEPGAHGLWQLVDRRDAVLMAGRPLMGDQDIAARLLQPLMVFREYRVPMATRQAAAPFTAAVLQRFQEILPCLEAP